MNTVRAILEYKCYPIVFANTNVVLEEFQKVDTDEYVIHRNFIEIVESFYEEVDSIDDLCCAVEVYLDILLRNRYRNIFIKYSDVLLNVFKDYLELDDYRGYWMFDSALYRYKEGEGHDK